VASRLSDADPNLSILVAESGGNGSEDPLTKYPVLFAHVLDPTSKYTLKAEGNASAQVDGRQVTIPHGHILGGGSVANLMTYSRPYTYDFDSWNMPGWSYEDVLPYFKKVNLPLRDAMELS
jgi:choline dehydrogenase-like flavoprotein